MDVCARLEATVRRLPERQAVLGRDRSVTYAELWKESGEVLQALTGRGVGPGDLVVLADPNSVRWLAVFLGCLRAGVIVGVLDPTVPADRRDRIAAQLAARAIVLQDEVVFLSDPPSVASEPMAAIAAAGPRFVVFTSGSTGWPKGVLLSEANLVANIDQNIAAFDLTSDSVTPIFMPLSAYVNLHYAVACLVVGTTLVVEPNLSDLQGTLERFDKAGVTHLSVVPMALRSVLDRGDLETYPLAHVRCVRVGAGLLTAESAADTFRAFPGVFIVATYGMTEIGLVASRRWVAAPIEPATFIDLCPWLEVRAVPDDESGRAELELTSALLFGGYYLPDTNTVALRSGPYRTGDLGSVSPTGVLTLQSRKKAIAKVGGTLVDLDDLARMVAADPNVADCCAVGIEHPLLGEEVHVFASGQPSAVIDPVALGRRLLGETSMRSLPRIHVLPSLPRTAMGKISRVELERLAKRGANAGDR